MVWEEATNAVNEMRRALYELFISRNTEWQIYCRGWNNRATWMLPGGDWWKGWEGALLVLLRHVVGGEAMKPAPVAAAPRLADEATEGVMTEALSAATAKIVGYASVGGGLRRTRTASHHGDLIPNDSAGSSMLSSRGRLLDSCRFRAIDIAAIWLSVAQTQCESLLTLQR